MLVGFLIVLLIGGTVGVTTMALCIAAGQADNRENRNHDYSKFALTKEECSIVIQQNLEKGKRMIKDTKDIVPDLLEILNYQLHHMDAYDAMYVLCTCAYYIADYNPKLLG